MGYERCSYARNLLQNWSNSIVKIYKDLWIPSLEGFKPARMTAGPPSISEVKELMLPLQIPGI